MDRKKLIQKLENEVKEKTPVYISLRGENKGDKKLLKTHLLLIKFYDEEGDKSKTLVNYYSAVRELEKVSRTELGKHSYFVSGQYEKWLKNVKKTENEIKSYKKTLAEFANKYGVGMEESLRLAFIPEIIRQKQFLEF